MNMRSFELQSSPYMFPQTSQSVQTCVIPPFPSHDLIKVDAVTDGAVYTWHCRSRVEVSGKTSSASKEHGKEKSELQYHC